MAVSPWRVEVRHVPARKWYVTAWLGPQVLIGWGPKTSSSPGSWQNASPAHARKKSVEHAGKGYIPATLGELPHAALQRFYRELEKRLNLSADRIVFARDGSLSASTVALLEGRDASSPTPSETPPKTPRRRGRAADRIHVWL